LLKQTIKPDEILIIDDTPTNEIKNICEKYVNLFKKEKAELIYVKNVKKRSISGARNFGSKIARGEIILFLDSDVILYPDYIEKVLSFFEKYPKILGVGGWPDGFRKIQITQGIFHYVNISLLKLFFLWHNAINSCNCFELPLELRETTYCQYLNGQSMSLKRSVLNEFQFDENLTKYSFMEDFLFSASIDQKHPKTLIISPEIRLIHNAGTEGRPSTKELGLIKTRNRKYVLMKLWGSKGLLMFGWENFGLLILKRLSRIRKFRIDLNEV